jgi:hypothetical protein
MSTRDNFNSATTEVLTKRAGFICSNPACRCMTVAASDVDARKFLYTGKAAHITAAAPGGPRHDPSLTSAQRAEIGNAIFLCSNCAEMIDKNAGIDYSTAMLLDWKMKHEIWIRENLNKSIVNSPTIVDGQHHARGTGNVTGLEIKKPAVIQPGTVITAGGTGNITATKIG